MYQVRSVWDQRHQGGGEREMKAFGRLALISGLALLTAMIILIGRPSVHYASDPRPPSVVLVEEAYRNATTVLRTALHKTGTP